MTNIFFPLFDNDSNPLTGSKTSLFPIYAPYLIGSPTNPTGSFKGSTFTFSDNNGVAWFLSVIPGIYNFSYTNANNNTTVPGTYTNEGVTTQTINVLEMNGQTVNGWLFAVVPTTQTNPQSIYAYSTVASDNRYILSGSVIPSSSYTSMASYAVNADTSSTTISSSYADFSTYALSASYSLTTFSASVLVGLPGPYYGQPQIDINGNSGSLIQISEAGDITIHPTTDRGVSIQNTGIGVISNDSNGISLTMTTGSCISLGTDGTIVLTDASAQGQHFDGLGNVSFDNLINGTASFATSASVLFGNSPSYSSNYVLTGSFNNIQTSSYILNSSDAGKVIMINAISTVYVGVPNTLNQGFACSIWQRGNGQVIVTGSGTTIYNSINKSASFGQFATITLFQGLTPSEYCLVGNVG